MDISRKETGRCCNRSFECGGEETDAVHVPACPHEAQ